MTYFIFVRRPYRLLLLPAILLLSLLFQSGRHIATTTGESPIRQGDPNQPFVALMINVDWGEEFLPEMLKVMQQKNVKATFFVVGRWARKNPELLLEIAKQGHEIASHGDQHKLATNLPPEQLDALVFGGINTLRQILGKDPAPLFAPPSGDCDARVVRAALRHGCKTILWTLDTIDWKRPPADTIVKRAVDDASNGALILMHPTKPTLEALPRIIDGLRQKGLEPATVTKTLGA